MSKWFEVENEFENELDPDEKMVNSDSLCTIFKANEFHRNVRPKRYEIISLTVGGDNVAIGSYTTAEKRDRRYEEIKAMLFGGDRL